eukprot:CAMPEP_0176356872 /NCGR_PEP_ID=MMETSP0126-20121128/14341_1 /TAXON_ID=141414 ORGANISM="Strombidinopsis acuminatum, Strain SPMC142" /NCGR_SAMPLE_ID=MMETSP0126 /ASSEMBLY_ACC=CAM_ASM_000229 /LENGTH=168 /DNA_ID=CAMNT_0017710181 /DNA_START=382 /DNA_END=885 /DNA_ORIENTATION=-
MHHIDDLPYNPKQYLPDTYSAFRRKNQNVEVREMLPNPKKGDLPPMPKKVITNSELISEALEYEPKMTDFGFKEEETPEHDKRSSCEFVGGEDRGLKRLNEYYFEKKAIGHYSKTRNQVMGNNFASFLSPWMANGTLSPRKIYFELLKFEDKHGCQKDTTKFFDELMW